VTAAPTWTAPAMSYRAVLLTLIPITGTAAYARSLGGGHLARRKEPSP